MELIDRVEQISALIADLRQSAGDGRKSRELIDSLFRAVHSFKAAASAEGRHDASGAAHEFENLLQALRTGELKLDNELLQFLNDSAAGLLDGTGASSLDSFTLLKVDKVRGQALLPDEFATLRDEERHRATAALQEGANLYVMEVVYTLPDFDVRFRQLKEKLGEIISTQPRAEEDLICFRIVYAAKSEKIRVQTIFEQAVRAGKSLATALNKQIEFVVQGEESLLDYRSSDGLPDALLHLVRNAIDHGIESHGTVVLEAATTPNATLITVSDNGQGIASENLPHVFQPGFTTAGQITEVSGRGVGLDAVKTIVENLGGNVSVTSEPGKGSSFQITIPSPITMANPS